MDNNNTDKSLPTELPGDDSCDLDELRDLIADEDWDAVTDWAIDHESSNDPLILEKIPECYRLASDNGLIRATVCLANLYYVGRFVEQDYKEAFRLNKIAADAGDRQGLTNCGYCCYYGRHQAVDYEKAHSYFSLGAVLYGDPNCLYKLGDMYLNGYHVAKNEIYALMLYRRAYATARCTKEHDCMADIQLRLGRCFLRGIGMPRDVLKAHKFLQKALNGFFARSRKDPFVLGLVRDTESLIAEAVKILEQRILDQREGSGEDPD